MTGLLLGLLISVNIYIDLYGVFRTTKNRYLVVYGDDRVAKYLLSLRYVPENFDAILVGPSISSNWDTHQIHHLRVYNESLDGSNFVEQQALVQHALSRPGIRCALILIHPSLTADHSFDTVPLTEREKFEALGSITLFEAYKDWFARWRHPEKVPTDDYGSDFFDDPIHLNAAAARLMRPGGDFPVDPIAVDAYRAVLADCRRHHVRMIFIVPPTSRGIFELKRAAFAQYLDLMKREIKPEDRVLDFSSQKYASFRDNPANFSDGVHIARAATGKLIALLNRELDSLKAEGFL